MASDLNIPQFGTGATPGLNAPRMQAIWTFLKSIALGGSGSVVKADNALQLAATTPSAVGLSMLSAVDKAAQQALVSLPEVSDSGLVAHWSMDSVPEIPDNPAGVTFSRDTWIDASNFHANTGALSVVNGKLRITLSANVCNLYQEPIVIANKTVKIKVKSSSPIVEFKYYNGTAYVITEPLSVNGDEYLYNYYPASQETNNSYYAFACSGAGYIDFDFIYIGTGAYLPASLIDNSGNGNHGTIYGATPVEGISGKALAFDGANDYADFGNVANQTGDFSVSFFINASSTYTDSLGKILGKKAIAGLAKGYSVYYQPSSRKFLISTGDGTTAYEMFNTTPISENAVHHIVVVRERGATNNGHIYIDGVKDSLTGAIFAGDVSNSEPLTIGGYSAASLRFSGTIDEPRIYNRALSAEEVYSLYMSKGRGPDAQVKSVRGVANSLVVRNASGQLQDMADYGIGTKPPAVGAVSLNSLLNNGLYAFSDTATGAPNTGSYGEVLVQSSLNGQFIHQTCTTVISAAQTYQHIRFSGDYGATWGAWYQIFNASTDGNGGQPPAPKPNTTALAVGKVDAIIGTDGASVTVPNVGSQYITWLSAFTSATNAPYGVATGYWSVAISAANTTIAGIAGVRMQLNVWRIL